MPEDKVRLSTFLSSFNRLLLSYPVKVFSRDVAEGWIEMEGWLLPDPVLLGEQSLSKERGREKELGNSFNRYVVSRMTRLYRSRNSFRFVPRFLIEGKGCGGWTFVSNRGYRSPRYGKHWRIVGDLRFEKSSRIRWKLLDVDWVFTGYRRSTGDSRWKRHQAYYFFKRLPMSIPGSFVIL